jgi:hypothetical protein
MARPPLIVIGAPRSGTNMLRDLLTEPPSHATWPCDEINYIWRHGNMRHPNDRFTPEMATPEITAYIQSRFRQIARRYDAATIVEKTCANSLRVGFVDRIFPEARYVFIARNGVDAAASTMKRWTASAEFGYLARKARWVPPRDLPYYGLRFVRNRWHRIRSSERRLAFWGPALEGMQELVASRPLAEVCAIQWGTCVTTALDDLAAVPPERKLALRYEDFVRDPHAGWERLRTLLDDSLPPASALRGFADVTPGMIGKGERQLDETTLATVRSLVAPVEARLDQELG